MSNNDIGYHEDPKNSDGIIRARTTKQIRSWELPRTMKALESLNNELGKIEFPGIYTLFEGKNKVYIGEAKNVYNRLKTHMTNPEDKIKNWSKALVINDGRPATQSDFNDTVVRKALELYLIKLFKDKTAYEQDTIDIWIVFAEEKATLSYKKNTIDVTNFRLID
jgi:hypothetical protein